MNTQRQFIFLDPSGRRWPRLQVFFLLLILVSIGCALSFIRSILVTPILRLPPQVRELKGQLHALQKENPAAQKPVMKEDWLKFYKQTNQGMHRNAILRRKLKAFPPVNNLGRVLRVAFYVDGDPNSYDSLVAHASELTHLIPEWFHLRNTEGEFVNQSNLRVANLARSHGLALMPLLSNRDGELWQPEAVENLAWATTGGQERFFNRLVEALHNLDAGGVVLDWEKIDPAYRAQYTILLHRLSDRLHGEGLQLWLCVPASTEFSTFDLEAITPFIDHFVAILQDETGEEDAPGPIASQDWFEGWLHVFVGYGEPSQWIACVGAYGYDWQSGKPKAESISFIDAMTRAAHAGVKEAKSVSPSYNPHFAYQTKDNTTHEVWFLDVSTFLNQWQSALDEGVGGIGIYRLGTEDPSLWYALLSGPKEGGLAGEELQSLQNIKPGGAISNIDQGEFISVDLSQQEGRRTFGLESHNRYTSDYLTFPLYPTLYHQGQGSENEVALSFDDGPDPTWTPKILKILQKNNLKAAFFITGKQAEEHPDLVRRIVAEGQEIGNHTYSHPNLSLVSLEQVKIELNATQRIVEAITGRSTTLFRPPYNADSHPHKPSELEAMDRAQDLGYLTVCENIDPEDWSRPGAETIVQRIREQRSLGSIILLHDAGGDRSQTVKALPEIIDYLQKRGDEIVPLSRLLGVPRDQLMPVVNPSVSSYENFVASTGFSFLRGTEELLWAFMIFASSLLFLRTIVVALLSLRYRPIAPPPNLPPLSVIIAAYNEEKIIAATLRSVLSSIYPNQLEIILIDDGSSDRTFFEAQKIARLDSRVRVFQQTNLGKAQALRHGLRRANHSIVAFLDADTQLQSEALQHLVAPFQDPNVGGVSGHAKVGNLRTLIARCQALEYTCGFNLDRRAYDLCNAITVVPGAISAARVSALEAAGGISDDTLAEDTDLTLSLHRLHRRIVYAEKAIAWTEAPESLSTLARQRFRWAFGTLQCLWKHHDLVFSLEHGWLGLFSLPSVWFFQIILVALAPLVDTLLFVSLILGTGAAVLPYFLGFLLLDLLLALTACLIEREAVSNLLFILPMRIIYRPLLTYVLWGALTRAMKGAWVGWGKLERTASVGARV